MRPEARIAAAISILDTLCAQTTPVDRALSSWARSNRYAGSKDRRAIADHVYQAIRHAFQAGAIMGCEAADSGRAIMLGNLKLQGLEVDEIAALFSGEKYAPDTLTADEIAHLTSDERVDSLAGLPMPFRRALAIRAGDDEQAAFAALIDRAPLDIRFNELLGTPDNILNLLNEDGFETSSVSGVPSAVRLADGAKISDSEIYKNGLVEVQDAGSQVAASLVPIGAGETVIDYCAGGGGKALALASMSGGECTIFAHDIAPGRLESLKLRARRAKARNIVICDSQPLLMETLDRMGGAADHVVLDVPCSGSGALRRNPETLWRFDEARLAELCRTQAEILREVSPLVKSGGAITYITCSILLEENERIIDRFLAECPGFEVEPIGTDWPAGQIEGTVQLMPHLSQTDGFFIARLRRSC